MSDREKTLKDFADCEPYACDLPAVTIKSRVYIDVLELLKEQAWHLLKEDADGLIRGLPGDDGQYLMTDGDDIWIDDYVDGVDDGVWLDSGRDIREVKAWMYMPELPKQEGR